MRAYEVMFILAPTMDIDAADQLARRIAELVQRTGGIVEGVEPWGKRRLAYEIQHHREGIYYVMRFRGETNVPAEVRRVLGLADDVLRFLVMRTDEADAAASEGEDGEEAAEADEEIAGAGDESATVVAEPAMAATAATERDGSGSEPGDPV